MATSTTSTIEEHITCGICLEIYKHPHALKCLHTYCFDCIQGLKCGNKVQCPDCRKSTNIKDIQREFKIQSMIDFHRSALASSVQKSKTSHTNGKECEVCKVSDKVVKSVCSDCDEYMCEDCERAHKGSKATKNHILLPYVDLCKARKQELEKHICGLQNERSLLANAYTGNRKACNNIRVRLTEQIAEVDNRRDNLKKQIDLHHDKLIEQIKSFHNLKNEALEKLGCLMDECEKDLDEKISFLSEILECQDIEVLNNTLDHVADTTDELLTNIRSYISNNETWLKSTTEIEIGQNWNPEEHTKVKATSMGHITIPCRQQKPVETRQSYRKALEYSHTNIIYTRPKKPGSVQHGLEIPWSQAAMTPQPHKMPGSAELESDMGWSQPDVAPLTLSQYFPQDVNKAMTDATTHQKHSQKIASVIKVEESGIKMIHSRYKQAKSHKIKVPLCKMCLIGEELWCAAGEHGIIVYNAKFEEVNQIQNALFNSITGIASLSNGDIIVSDSQSGLLLLDHCCTAIFTIDKNGFSDVSVCGEIMYALQCEKCEVHIYTTTSRIWLKNKEFKLKYKCGSWSDSLIATQDHVVICSQNNDCIYIHDAQSGKFLLMTGVHGGTVPGELDQPHLCDADRNGNVLVSDYGNNRLQMFNVQTNQWKELMKPQSPVSAVIGEDFIFVGTQPPHVSNKLLKYTRVS